MNAVVDINGRAVARIEYKNQPVVTLPMVDEVHERPKRTAAKAFNRHKKRMIEGEDYFYVPQEEWKTLLTGRISSHQNQKGGIRFHDMEPDHPKLTSRYGGEMVFLTETGYLMLVKVFDDDLSWQVQRQLVRRYFAARETTVPGKRVEVGYFRGTTAPGGLDIRYTLDLTKLCVRPTRAGVMLLSRLTGIEMEDLAEEIQETATVRADPGVIRFAAENLREDEEQWTPIARIHGLYRKHCAAAKERPLPIAAFCHHLRRLYPAVSRTRSSHGNRPWGYQGLAMK